jgi:hypothetical protein
VVVAEFQLGYDSLAWFQIREKCAGFFLRDAAP